MAANSLLAGSADDEVGNIWLEPPSRISGSDGRVITLVSFGRDGKPGGSGEDADLRVTRYSKVEGVAFASKIAGLTTLQ